MSVQRDDETQTNTAPDYYTLDQNTPITPITGPHFSPSDRAVEINLGTGLSGTVHVFNNKIQGGSPNGQIGDKTIGLWNKTTNTLATSDDGGYPYASYYDSSEAQAIANQAVSDRSGVDSFLQVNNVNPGHEYSLLVGYLTGFDAGDFEVAAISNVGTSSETVVLDTFFGTGASLDLNTIDVQQLFELTSIVGYDAGNSVGEFDVADTTQAILSAGIAFSPRLRY